jgi:hypothetical protein
MKVSINTQRSINLELSEAEFNDLIWVFDKLGQDYVNILDETVVWSKEDYDKALNLGFYLKLGELKAKLGIHE